MTALVKQLEKKVFLLENEKRLVQKIDEKRVRRYCEHRSVVGRSIKKLVKRVTTRFVRTELCIKRAFPKLSLQEISELHYYSKQLLCNWTGRFDQSFGNGIDFHGVEDAVPLDLF